MVLSGPRAVFIECWFGGMAKADNVIYVDDNNCEVLILSSRFDAIVDHSHVLFFMRSKNVSIRGVCFSDCTLSSAVYGAYQDTSWAVTYACVNYTVESDNGKGSVLTSSYMGGIEGFIYQFNNRTHLKATASRSTFCLHHSPPYLRDTIRFNSGDNCAGPWAFDLHSDINGNFYSHFNLVNNSAPSGFFRVVRKVGNILSNFNFYFSEPTNWVYQAEEVFGIWDCYIGGLIPPSSPYVVTENLQEVESIELEKYVTYAPFCFAKTSIFSVKKEGEIGGSKSMISLIFLPIIILYY